MKKILLILFLVNITTFFNVKAERLCNTNLHCNKGWFCLGGTGTNLNVNLTGICKPTTVLKQYCYDYKIATGQFGRLVILIALTLLAVGFLAGKIQFTQFLTFFLGTALILGGFQYISFITRDQNPVCDFSN